MTARIGLMCCAFLWSLCVTGCDPMRSTAQRVTVKVVDTATHRGVVGARVGMIYDYRRANPGAERDPYWLEWHHGITDVSGEATVDIRLLSLDRTVGSMPPASADTVTRYPYVVTVHDGVTVEELHLIITNGASAAGEKFTVSIPVIQAPRYVPTHDTTAGRGHSGAP